MSPIDYPDLLAPDGADAKDEGRGRKSSATRIMSSLRSRSRSRPSSSSDTRRSASAQPSERRSSTKEKSKRRRSLSRHAGRSEKKHEETSKKEADILDLSKSIVKKRSKSKDKDKTKKKSKSASPSRRKPSAANGNIINLVDADEHDFLLNKLLTEENPKLDKKKSSIRLTSRSAPSSPNKRDPTPTAKHHNYSPRSVERFSASHRREDSSMSDVDDESDNDSITATDLLEKVNARMEQQKLMEELKELRRVIERKNSEIEQLTGQLRMAISTKCDLVIAHTELERIHEMDMEQKDAFANELKRNTLRNLEIRAEIEIEFMNELDSLAKKVEVSERRRKDEVLEKDMEIAQLQERIRRLERNAAGFSSVRPEDEKVRYYKKRLGLHDQ